MPLFKTSRHNASVQPKSLSTEAAPRAAKTSKKTSKKLKMAEDASARPERKGIRKKFHKRLKALRRIFSRRAKVASNGASSGRHKVKSARTEEERESGNVFTRALHTIRGNRASGRGARKKKSMASGDHISQGLTLPHIIRNEKMRGLAAEQAAMPLDQLKKEINVLLTQQVAQHSDNKSQNEAALQAIAVTEKIIAGSPISEVAPDFIWAEEFGALNDAHDFASQMEDVQLEIANLALKVEEGTASINDREKLSVILHQAQSNLAIAQTHLGDMFARHTERASLLKKPVMVQAGVTTQALSDRLAAHHMAIADMISRYGAELPPSARLTRPVDKINRDLRDAQGLLNALKLKKEKSALGNDPGINAAIEKLESHCASLEKQFKAHKKAAMGQDDGSVALSDKLIADRPPIDLGFDEDMMPDPQLLAQGREQAINQASWPEIENHVEINFNGEMHNYKSTVTPGGSDIAKKFAHAYTGGVAAPGHQEIFHAPNLAQSRLATEDGEVLFKTVRHAALNPEAITPAFLRSLPPKELQRVLEFMYWNDSMATDETANLAAFAYKISSEPNDKNLEPVCASIQANIRQSMAQEVIAATLISDANKYQQAVGLANFEDAYNPETDKEVVAVPVNAISLMTPAPSQARGSERAVLSNQLEALQAASHNGAPFKLPIRNPEGTPCFAPVKVELRQFNFAVDPAPRQWRGVPLGRVPLPGPLLRHVTGWGYSTQVNDPALTNLLGDRQDPSFGGAVKTKLESLEMKVNAMVEQRNGILRADPDLQHQRSVSVLRDLEQQISNASHQGEKITQCAKQVKEIWQGGKFRSAGGEPHKLVSRLVLLCDAMGETPSISDMNGLDRVNRCDADAKYLAAALDGTGELPPPDGGADDEIGRAHFGLHAGGAELRRYNDGLPG